MKEEEWLASTHFERMYVYLKRQRKLATTKAGRRRFRLFACGCCRRLLWHLPLPEGSRLVVEAAEAFADGAIDREGLMRARATGRVSFYPWTMPDAERLNLAAHCMMETTGDRAAPAAYCVTQSVSAVVGKEGRIDARALMCDLLRDIFSDPFKPPRAIEPDLLAWEGGTVRRLAEAAYEERDFSPGTLGVLADALEDAGCADDGILGHLRGEKPHVRGCWVVDLLTGRE